MEHLITSGANIQPRCSCGAVFETLGEALSHQAGRE